MAEAIVGRRAELSSVSEFVSVHETGPAALVLEGEPGIGKTTLWNAGLALASETSSRVLVGRPVESEEGLPFAALGDLLVGVPGDVMKALPRPQRRALAVALMQEDAKEVPPPLAVALAFLGVLRTLSQDVPVLLGIDDLHWIDPSSLTALLFALRRLQDRRVGLLATRRLDADERHVLENVLGQHRVNRLVMGPLTHDELEDLLVARLAIRLPRPVLARIEGISGGNPFFAIEIGRALERRGGWPATGESLPVPESLQQLVRERLADLPPPAREVALVASALSRPSIDLVEAVESSNGAASVGIAQAVESGILVLEGTRIRFAHPLLSWAVYANATPAMRNVVHRRLAAVVEESEERARHLGLAATGTNEDVAGLLEAAAQRARARGAPETAAELLEQARTLTPRVDPDAALRRGVRASEHLLESGDVGRARAVLEELLVTSRSGLGRARVLSLLAWIRNPDEGWPGIRLGLEEARAETGDELVLRGEIELGLAYANQMCGEIVDAVGCMHEVLRLAALTANRALQGEGIAGLAFLRAMLGEGIDRAAMDQAVALERGSGRLWAIFRPRWLLLVMLQWAGDLDGARSVAEALLDEAAERGDIHSETTILTQLARVQLLAGCWEQARLHADEADLVAEQIGGWQQRVFSLSTRAMVAAHLGEVSTALELSEEAMVSLGVGRSPSSSTIAGFELRATLGFLELSRGAPDAAMHHLALLAAEVEAAKIGDPVVFRFHADAIEAMLEMGELQGAKDLLQSLDCMGASLDHPWIEVVAARCHGLVAGADGHLDESLRCLNLALRLHSRLRQPFELGRTLLALGMTQRRTKLKSAARQTLEKAAGVFGDLGAELWAKKARAESSRIGGRAPGRWDLTPTERRVALLASKGRTNKEIGAALYVSPKTVEANLTQVYRKLAVRSRTELARLVLDQNRDAW